MSTQTKILLGNKRQAIFSVEKDTTLKNSNTPHKSSQKKNTSINSSIEEIEIDDEFPENPNFRTKKQLQKNSLIIISQEVHKFIQENKITTGPEVTKHIINTLTKKGVVARNYKNIQRRVYDAINVMSSLKLIKKSKQNIELLPLQQDNNFSSNDGSQNNSGSLIKSAVTKVYSDESSNIENDDSQEIKDQIIKLKKAQKKLIEYYIKMEFDQILKNINNKFPERYNQEKLFFPFDLITYDRNSTFKIKSKDDFTRHIILSNSSFSRISEFEIMKRFVNAHLNDKLNYNENSPISINKNITAKKSLSEETKPDEGINNKFFQNIFEKENMLLESDDSNPLKVKILNEEIEISNNSEKSKKKNLNYKDEIKERDKLLQSVRDYLKNKKIFNDEMKNNENLIINQEEIKDQDYNSKIKEYLTESCLSNSNSKIEQEKLKKNLKKNSENDELGINSHGYKCNIKNDN